MTPTARQVVVAEVGEIPPDGRKIVNIDGRSIGVFHIGGEYFAVRNTCPHAGGPLCEGVRSGFVRSLRPGHYDYIRRGEFLRCPWHQWEFDIRTGQSWFDPTRVRVRRYDTRIVPGTELLDQGEAPGSEPPTGRDGELAEAGLLPGPFAVETYAVRATGKYVVIELSS